MKSARLPWLGRFAAWRRRSQLLGLTGSASAETVSLNSGRSRPRANRLSSNSPSPSTRRPIPTSTSSSSSSRTKPTRRRSRSRSSAPIRPTSSSTGPARMRRALPATGWRSTSPNSARPRRLREHALAEGWLSSFQVDGKYYGMPTDAVSKYFYYNKKFFAEHSLTPPADFDGLLGLCQEIRKIDPNIVPMPLGNSERWKLNHYITMLNERVLGAEAHCGGLRAHRARGQALHRSRLCRGLAESARPEERRLLAGRAERHLAGVDALDVLLRAVADDLLRLLVRRHLRRRRLHRLRHVPHAGGQGRQGRRRTPTSWCRKAS